MILTKTADLCLRCGGQMTSYIDEHDDLCLTCGWVRYAKEAEPMQKKKRGRPRGYSRKGGIRLDE